MGNVNTNLTDRIPARQPTQEVEIFEVADFPAIISGSITLVDDTSYRIMAPIVMPTDTVFLLPSSNPHVSFYGGNIGASIEFLEEGAILFEIQNLGSGELKFIGVDFILSGDDTQLFEVLGTGLVSLQELSLTFDTTTSGFGTVNGVTLEMAHVHVTDPTIAFNIKNCPSCSVSNLGIDTPGATGVTGGALFLFSSTCEDIEFTHVHTELVSGDAIFYIDPLIVGPVIITDMGDADPANVDFFLTTTEQIITAFSDGDTAGHTECAVSSHGYANTTPIWIANSAQYFGGYEVQDSQTNDFEIVVTWGTDDALPDTFVTDGSLDGRDPRITVIHSEGIEPSQTLCGVVAKGNATVTTIAVADTYVDLAFGTSAEQSAQMERFILADQGNAEIVYIGLEPLRMEVDVLIEGIIASGTSDQITIQLLQNDVVLADPDALEFSSIWNSTLPTQLTGQWFVMVEPDDTFNVEIKNVTDGEDLTIQNFSFVIH